VTGPAKTVDLSGLRSDRAGEVPEFDDTAAFKWLDPAPLQRATRLAVAAAVMAANDAGLDGSTLAAASERTGVVMGVVVANRPGLERPTEALYRTPEEPIAIPLDAHDVAWVSEAPAIELGLRGPVLVLPTACAAGNSAIGYAADLIRDGHADVFFAGGADELSPAMFMMFSQFDALAPDLLRPFDTRRKGLILAEGAAVLVLEAEAHARARGARVYGRVLGHGNFADSHDMMHPHPDGLGARLSMEEALRQSDVSPRDVSYVCAHGTGTFANDPIEAKAIRALFGSHADELPVSSIKSMLGHAQGAASAIEAVACLLAIRDGLVPPTMNTEEIDPACPIRVVTRAAERRPVRFALNNAFGFGGNISCVLFGHA
jgi:3-oxoacyl-[acyl-carrier-protein] synthase II